MTILSTFKLRNVCLGLLVLAASLPVAATVPVHASGPHGVDPCAAPLPVYLGDMGGGPTLRFTYLHYGGLRFRLIQFPDGLRGDLQQIHSQHEGPASLPGDSVGRFTFIVDGKAYDGPIHIFRHGAVQHFCLSGEVALGGVVQDYDINGPTQTVKLLIDGTMNTEMVQLNVVVGGAHYYLYGLPITRQYR